MMTIFHAANRFLSQTWTNLRIYEIVIISSGTHLYILLTIYLEECGLPETWKNPGLTQPEPDPIRSTFLQVRVRVHKTAGGSGLGLIFLGSGFTKFFNSTWWILSKIRVDLENHSPINNNSIFRNLFLWSKRSPNCN